MMESRGSTNSRSIAGDELPSVWWRRKGSSCAPSPRLTALIPGCKNKELLLAKMASRKLQSMEIGDGLTVPFFQPWATVPVSSIIVSKVERS